MADTIEKLLAHHIEDDAKSMREVTASLLRIERAVEKLDKRVWSEATGVTRDQAAAIAENRIRAGMWGGGMGAVITALAEGLRRLAG